MNRIITTTFPNTTNPPFTLRINQQPDKIDPFLQLPRIEEHENRITRNPNAAYSQSIPSINQPEKTNPFLQSPRIERHVK